MTGRTSVPESQPLRPGDPERLGDYEILGLLGEGGQGAVFLGRSAGGPRDEYVAIKLLHAGLSADSPARARFARELETAKRIARFCTAQVLDADMAGDHPYIVSEYVAGRSLHALVLEQGRRGGGALERLAIATLTALSAIHQAGIVHRDFKPHNILLGSDGPRVIDFGIARGLSAAGDTQNIGTPAYMAPEQFKGERPGPATDMFAWGTTMVFAATGRPAFGNDETAAVMHRIVYEEPDLGELPSPLREVVAACLAKDPGRRPSARDAQQRLMGGAHPGGVPQSGAGAPQPRTGQERPQAFGTRHGVTPLEVPFLGAAGVPADAFTSTPYSATGPGPQPPPAVTAPPAFETPPSYETPPAPKTPYAAESAPVQPEPTPAPMYALAAQELPLPATPSDPPDQAPAPLPPPPPPSPYMTRPNTGDRPERRGGLLAPLAAGLAVTAVVAGGTLWAATRDGGEPSVQNETTAAAASAGTGTAGPANRPGANAGRLNGTPSPGSTSLSTAPSGASNPSRPRRLPGQPAPQPTSSGGGGGNSAPPTQSNPYNARQVCNSGGHGSGYYVQRSSAFSGGRVYQLYNSSGYNCVVTLKTTNVGKKTSVWAQLTRKDGKKASDSGSYAYYAGPVFLSAPGQCVKYAGGTGSGSASAPWGNCG